MRQIVRKLPGRGKAEKTAFVTCSSKSGILSLNAAAVEKFNLKGVDHIELFLDNSEILVKPVPSRTNTSFTLSIDGKKSKRFNGAPFKKAGVDVSLIKRQPVHARDGYLVIPIPTVPESEPEPAKEFAVTGEMTVIFNTTYVGKESEAKAKLMDFVSECMAGTVDFEDSEVELTSVKEVEK